MTGGDDRPDQPTHDSTARPASERPASERPGPIERHEQWRRHRRPGAWGPPASRAGNWDRDRWDASYVDASYLDGVGGPPWARRHGRAWHRGWFVRRFAGFIVGVIVLLAVVLVIAGWLAASLLGLLGSDVGGGGPVIVGGRFVVGLLIIGVVVTLVGWRVRRFVEPLDELADATRRVAAGDYSARVTEPWRGPRELRELTRGFNTMAERLDIDERQRRTLLSDVSHELRTPLAVVQGNIEAMVDGVHPPDEKHLTAILDETRVLGRLIEDLRTLALSEAGTLPLHQEPTDLDALAADVARSHAGFAEAAGITLTAGEAADLPIVEVDPVRIREVIGNLVANALRYTPPGGRIMIATSLAGTGEGDARSRVRVEVRDTGSGLSPDVAANPFDRFAKSSDSRGSGLGLAIAKQLVEAHGGRIGLDSRAGAGATAWFELPLNDQER